MPRPRLEDRYDSLIAYTWWLTANRFAFDTAVDWRLFKALIKQESSFNPNAVNKRTGALGLPQLMAREDLAIDGTRNADNPEVGIREGLIVLAGKWSIFKAEAGLERWRFALAAYDGGERDLIRAQELLRAKGQPTDQWVYVAMVLPEIKSAEAANENRAYVRDVIDTYQAWAAKPDPYAD